MSNPNPTRALWLIFAALASLALLSGPVSAVGLITFGPFAAHDFSPARGERFPIACILAGPAEVRAEIYTADNALIRTLRSAGELPAGEQTLVWDGRDEDGTIVPDEVYTVVLQAVAGELHGRVDPRRDSGGEIDKDLRAAIGTDGSISFHLARPSRVQIRAGIEEGPMLRSLLDWEPRTAGKNIVVWNGMDGDNLVDFLANEKFSLSIAAFWLPAHSIITTGNEVLSYERYVIDHGLAFQPVPEEERLLERGDRGVSHHYYARRLAERNPRISIHFPASVKRDAAGLAVLAPEDPVPITVTMNPEDERSIDESKYEVTFFVDFAFMSEEELGFMPITWLWQPNNLAAGEHLLTVNVSGFKGQVGVRSIAFKVE